MTGYSYRVHRILSCKRDPAPVIKAVPKWVRLQSDVSSAPALLVAVATEKKEAGNMVSDVLVLDPLFTLVAILSRYFVLFLKADVEETLKRIQGQKGVQGIIIFNTEGIPIKSTMDNQTTVQYAGLMHQLVIKARSSVRDIDAQNDLTFLRIRSKKNEIMVAPDKDYFLIVIQQPTE
ncbi:dynein light chain roadblock-type 1 [Pelodytes ibericus]